MNETQSIRSGIFSLTRLELAWWLIACVLALGVPIFIRATAPASEPVVSIKLDLNAAQREDLMSLPGMNARRARAILQAREKRGRFATLADFAEVKGVTKAYVARIEEMVEVK